MGVSLKKRGLVDWTGRKIKEDKRGATDSELQAILALACIASIKHH